DLPGRAHAHGANGYPGRRRRAPRRLRPHPVCGETPVSNMACSMRSLACLVVGLAAACGHKDDAKPQPPEPPPVAPAVAPDASPPPPDAPPCAPATIYLERDH